MAKQGNSSGGTVVVAVFGFAVLAYLIYLLSKQLPTILSNLAGDKTTKDLVNSSTTTDGTTVSDVNQGGSFTAQAKTIADAQYNAMQGAGTYEYTLYSGLEDLNGAQLQLVYQEFGKRDGKNLFEWYADELSTTTWFGGVWWSDKVPNCENYTDFCSEVEFMRELWKKSGLPLTF